MSSLCLLTAHKPTTTSTLFTLLLIFTTLASALQVTPNSPCASICMDSPDLDKSDPKSSNTKNKDITCMDAAYASVAGTQWKSCMSCLQTSTFSQGLETDQMWFLYNMRYAVSYCIFGFPNAVGVGSTPCSTSTACGPLQAGMQHGIQNPSNMSTYSYCYAGGDDTMEVRNYEKCTACVSAEGHTEYLANYVVALEAGCKQQPPPGRVVGLSGTVFVSETITIVDPDTLNSDSHHGPALSTTVIVGIVVAIVAIILIISGVLFVCLRRRRNKRARGTDKQEFYDRIRHQRQSSLSFQCQTHMASPRHRPGAEEPLPTQDDMADAPWPLTQDVRDASRPSSIWKGQDPELQDKSQAPPYSPEDPPFDEKTALSKRGSSGLGLTNVPLHNLKTSLPTMPPHAYTTPSPASMFYSPTDFRSPMSADSVRSTTGLLPAIKKYVPAEYAGTSPTQQRSPSAFSPVLPTPISAVSPHHKGYPWPDQHRRSSAALAPTSAVAPRLNVNINTVNLSPTTAPSPKGTSSRYSLAAAATWRSQAPKIKESGSPVESWEIQTAFAAPPTARK
ncbi:hypothetical protein B0H63DRAFT_225953 [Podospora didyma]|uniref:LPXTG-domain-containing protein n=1 Tax=Podospora didyma TaxID=330526 RepID=A0AAE0KJI1_9PEZI|nr:hypothetical protein B0H63DRAFT_225953 [Podospora didyma]